MIDKSAIFRIEPSWWVVVGLLAVSGLFYVLSLYSASRDEPFAMRLQYICGGVAFFLGWMTGWVKLCGK